MAFRNAYFRTREAVICQLCVHSDMRQIFLLQQTKDACSDECGNCMLAQLVPATPVAVSTDCCVLLVTIYGDTLLYAREV
jgi:hypothetical protein